MIWVPGKGIPRPRLKPCMGDPPPTWPPSSPPPATLAARDGSTHGTLGTGVIGGSALCVTSFSCTWIIYDYLKAGSLKQSETRGVVSYSDKRVMVEERSGDRARLSVHRRPNCQCCRCHLCLATKLLTEHFGSPSWEVQLKSPQAAEAAGMEAGGTTGARSSIPHLSTLKGVSYEHMSLRGSVV